MSVDKKEDKNLLKNYSSISLLPIFGKIFEGEYVSKNQNAKMDFYPVILSCHSCYLLFMISILLLIAIQLLMSEVYS